MEDDCGTIAGYRHHLLKAEPVCAPCQDALAEVELERVLSRMTWPAERVMLSVLVGRRPDLATLPLIGTRIAAGFAESI